MNKDRNYIYKMWAIVHKSILPSIVVLVATINILGCTGESTVFKLQRDEAYTDSKAKDVKRVALVIGNSSYTAVPELKNPANDAQDLEKELSSLGFEVIKKENVETSKEMRELVHNFGNKLRGGGVGLFYYSGHGIQVNGENYLIPTTANLRSEADVGYEAVDMKYVQATMNEANNGMNIVVLDACRDNPFARSLRRGTRGIPQLGLANMNSAKGSLIAFSTAPGTTAEDGSGRNGTYTKHFLANIKQPGLDIERLFKKVRIGVAGDTGGQQIPWESTSVTGKFCFAGCEDPNENTNVKIKIQEAHEECERLRQEIAQRELENARLKSETKNLTKRKNPTKKRSKFNKKRLKIQQKNAIRTFAQSKKSL